MIAISAFTFDSVWQTVLMFNDGNGNMSINVEPIPGLFGIDTSVAIGQMAMASDTGSYILKKSKDFEPNPDTSYSIVISDISFCVPRVR